MTTPTAEKRKPGRPRLYTPEEAKERARLQAAKRQAEHPEWKKANQARWLAKHPGRKLQLDRAWRAANPEKVKAATERSAVKNRARAAAWAKANPERVREIRARAQVVNPTRLRPAHQKWVEENRIAQRPKRVIIANRRRAKLKNAPGRGFTHEQWLETLEVFAHRCAYCLRNDLPMTIDHVIAISVGGANDSDNIVPACWPCNRRKHARGILCMLRKAA